MKPILTLDYLQSARRLGARSNNGSWNLFRSMGPRFVTVRTASGKPNGIGNRTEWNCQETPAFHPTREEWTRNNNSPFYPRFPDGALRPRLAIVRAVSRRDEAGSCSSGRLVL